MCGINKGLDLDKDIDRRYTLYKFRGRKFTSHVSLVFQPWESHSQLDNSPLDFYHIVEVIEEGSDFKLNMRETEFDAKLLKLGDTCISIHHLYMYLAAIYLIWKTYLDPTCGAFSNIVSIFLLDEVSYFQLPKQPHLKTQTALHVRSGLTKYVESILLNDDQDRANYFSSNDNYLSKARVVRVFTTLKSNHKGLCVLNPALVLFMMSFQTIGELFIPWFLIVFMAHCYYVDIFEMNVSNVATTSWYNKLLFLRKMVFLISISCLLLGSILDFENCISVSIFQFIWSHLLVLDFEINKKFAYVSKCVGHITNVWQLLKLSWQQDIFRVLIILSFFMPSLYCLISITLIPVYLLTTSRTSTMLRSFTNLGSDKKPGSFAILLYIMGIISCCCNGVIREPLVNLSKLHIIAMFIYTRISWSVHQISTAGLHDDIVRVSQDILLKDITHDSQYTESKFPFFCTLLKFVNLVCKFFNFTYLLLSVLVFMCFEMYLSLLLFVIVTYIHFVITSLLIDVEQVVYCTAEKKDQLRY